VIFLNFSSAFSSVSLSFIYPVVTSSTSCSGSGSGSENGICSSIFGSSVFSRDGCSSSIFGSSATGASAGTGISSSADNGFSSISVSFNSISSGESSSVGGGGGTSSFSVSSSIQISSGS